MLSPMRLLTRRLLKLPLQPSSRTRQQLYNNRLLHRHLVLLPPTILSPNNKLQDFLYNNRLQRGLFRTKHMQRNSWPLQEHLPLPLHPSWPSSRVYKHLLQASKPPQRIALPLLPPLLLWVLLVHITNTPLQPPFSVNRLLRPLPLPPPPWQPRMPPTLLPKMI